MSIARFRTPISMTLFGLAMATMLGCKKDADAPPTMPPPKVTVARPATQPVQAYYEYNGHLDAVESVEIRARVKGLLKEVHFVEGEEVEQNAPLYTIDPREYQTGVARSTADLAKATAEIENWKAQIKLAETELSRVTRLPIGAVPQSEIDKARAMVQINIAQLGVAQASKEAAAAALQTANIQLGYTDIRAPIGGRISRTLVTKGNLVGQDQTTLLTTIVSVDPLHVYFDAPERDLSKYQRMFGAKGETEAIVEIGIANEPGYPHRGKIDFRENRVDIGTGTIRLRGQIPNPGSATSRQLYPGLYARVRVLAGAPEPRLVIPEEALMTGQEGRFVLVVGDKNIIEKRPVTVGVRVWQAVPPGEVGPPGWVLANPNPSAQAAENAKEPAPLRMPLRSMVSIEKGLKAEDRIVVVGLQRARPGAPVTPDLWDLQAPKKDEGK